MKEWLDPKIASVLAIIFTAERGVKLSSTDWTTNDILYGILVVVVGTIFWGVLLTALYKFLNRRK